jgi:serine/threonine-protein kinase
MTGAVPAERVHAPLRALIARGMAKDPAARPADALELVAELEATAAAAYGADWESRGRAHIAARAAALLLLLTGAPAVAGTAGASATITVITTAAGKGTGKGLVVKAITGKAIAGKIAGLGGLQLAIVTTTAVVIAAGGAAAGGWTLGKQHAAVSATASSTASQVSPTGSPGSPTASPGPRTAPLSSPACGTGPPPLAYITSTVVGATSLDYSVVVRCGAWAPAAAPSPATPA